MSIKILPICVEDIPDEPFFAILTPKITHVEGDERSKTNPGHGYPAHDIRAWSIRAFDSFKEWEKEIVSLESKAFNKSEYRAIKIIPAKITSMLKVDVNIEVDNE